MLGVLGVATAGSCHQSARGVCATGHAVGGPWGRSAWLRVQLGQSRFGLGWGRRVALREGSVSLGNL